MTGTGPRVLHVINGLGTGGAERSLTEVLPLLREHGIESAVACLSLKAEGVHADMEANGFPVHVLGGGRRSQAVTLRRLIGGMQPDLVHTTIYEADVLGRIAAVGTGAKVLTSLVNTTYDGARVADAQISPVRLAAAKAVDRQTGRRLTDHFHAISHAVKDSAVTHLGLRPERVTVIERGRDLSRLGRPSVERGLRVRAALGIPRGAEVVLHVGRQEPQKGQATLIEATAKLATRRPGVVLLQAGRDGKASAHLRHLAADAPAGTVRFLGHRTDVGDLLAAADVFAFPSVYEGLGGSILEAMAMRVPVVASRIPALSEVLGDGRAGVLVPVGDPSALAHAVEHVLDHPDEASRTAVEAEQIFFERFTLERSAARMAALYHQILEEGVR